MQQVHVDALILNCRIDFDGNGDKTEGKNPGANRPGHVIRLARGNVAWLQASSKGRNYDQTRFRSGILLGTLGARRTPPQRGARRTQSRNECGGSEVAENLMISSCPELLLLNANNQPILGMFFQSCTWGERRKYKQQSGKRKIKNLLNHSPSPHLRPHDYFHLITRSALASTFGGMVRPICLAVLRLITSSNFVGCSTGRSAGFAPFKILSTYVAAR